MDGKFKKKSDFVHIGSVIHKTLDAHVGKSGAEMVKIFDLWEEIVGEGIADNAVPAAFNNQVLIVHVSSSVWMQQLSFLKEEIIQKINDGFGKRILKDIQFKIGAVNSE